MRSGPGSAGGPPPTPWYRTPSQPGGESPVRTAAGGPRRRRRSPGAAPSVPAIPGSPRRSSCHLPARRGPRPGTPSSRSGKIRPPPPSAYSAPARSQSTRTVASGAISFRFPAGAPAMTTSRKHCPAATASRLTLSLVEAQSCDDEFDHAACIVAGVVVRADTEIADAEHQLVGVRVAADLSRPGSGVAQLTAHGDAAGGGVSVQSLEGGSGGLQRLGEAVVGDQEVDEEVDPPGQSR